MLKKNWLSFAKGNAKLNKSTAIFSLPAGHSCPGALQCMSRANKVTGKITDGLKTEFRCYAASAEALFKNIRKSRWHNLTLLQRAANSYDITNLIINSLPRKSRLCRIHASGDFFNQEYFDAWLQVARLKPNTIFYAYTKMLPLWVKRLNEIPFNLKLVASRGGRWDNLIEKHNLRNVKVVFSEAEAIRNNLPIDHDDTNAWKHNGNFALLIHGTQPAGSFASKSLSALRQRGVEGYKARYFEHYNKKRISQAEKLAIENKMDNNTWEGANEYLKNAE